MVSGIVYVCWDKKTKKIYIGRAVDHQGGAAKSFKDRYPTAKRLVSNWYIPCKGHLDQVHVCVLYCGQYYVSREARFIEMFMDERKKRYFNKREEPDPCPLSHINVSLNTCDKIIKYVENLIGNPTHSYYLGTARELLPNTTYKVKVKK